MEKITRKFLSDKYDELYDQAMILIQELNPCNIRPAPTSHERSEIQLKDCVVCNGGRIGVALCCAAIPGTNTPKCKHLGVNGCTVKSLRCRLWFCDEVNDGHMPSVSHGMVIIESQGEAYNNFTFRSHTPILNDQHLFLEKEMKKYRFNLLFREGKTKCVEEAYQSFKRGDSEFVCE